MTMTNTETQTQTQTQKTEPVEVAIWPCGTWCPLDETRDLQEMRAWMGDDYYVVDVTEWDETGAPADHYFK